MSQYFPPTIDIPQYHCPQCGVFASQRKDRVVFGSAENNQFSANRCAHCGGINLWHVPTKSLIFPDTGTAPMPHVDMPDDAKQDYNEARSIFGKSPKGAAALLRLALQKLLICLGEKGDNINNDIGALVQKKNLPPQIQQALDTVRIIGNCGVHPGEIKIDDTPDIALKMFELLNIIVQNQITQPKEIAALYGTMPPGKLAAVAKRDKPKP